MFTTIELKRANTVEIDWFNIEIITMLCRMHNSWFPPLEKPNGLILSRNFYSLSAQLSPIYSTIDGIAEKE